MDAGEENAMIALVLMVAAADQRQELTTTPVMAHRQQQPPAPPGAPGKTSRGRGGGVAIPFPDLMDHDE